MITSRISFQTIQQIPAFRNLNESECHQLVDIAHEKTFAPGEKVVVQGEVSQDLWIVMEGKCQVVKESEHDGAVVLADLDPFSLFGEMSFFSPAPHSANVVAKTPVKLMRITRVDYDDLIHDGVVAAYKLAYNVVESVAKRLRRMDDWVTELNSQLHPEANGSVIGTQAAERNDKLPEWRQFRNKLFNGWNL